jgi:hypothetical protein
MLFVFLIALIGLVIIAFVSCLISLIRSRPARWILPLGSAIWLVAGAVIGIGIARPLRAWTFLHRDLDRYEQAAAWIESQGVGGNNIRLPNEFSDPAYRVWARKTEQCGQMIH